LGANDEWSIHPNSRIGWFGCWLVLIQKTDSTNPESINHTKIIRRLFFFYDQFSKEDYARLCRLVNKNNYNDSTN